MIDVTEPAIAVSRPVRTALRLVGSLWLICLIVYVLAGQRIAWAQDKAKDPSLSLRLAVESGGCHGYQYKMEVTTKREPDD